MRKIDGRKNNGGHPTNGGRLKSPDTSDAKFDFRLPSDLKSWLRGRGGAAFVIDLLERERKKESE